MIQVAGNASRLCLMLREPRSFLCNLLEPRGNLFEGNRRDCCLLHVHHACYQSIPYSAAILIGLEAHLSTAFASSILAVVSFRRDTIKRRDVCARRLAGSVDRSSPGQSEIPCSANFDCIRFARPPIPSNIYCVDRSRCGRLLTCWQIHHFLNTLLCLRPVNIARPRFPVVYSTPNSCHGSPDSMTRDEGQQRRKDHANLQLVSTRG